MSVQLGISPLTWTSDNLPSLGAKTSLETCLSERKEAGFADFELGNKFPREARLLGPTLQRHDLRLVSGWYSGRLLEHSAEDEITAMQSYLTLLRGLGAKVPVFVEVSGYIRGGQQTPVHLCPHFPQECWKEYGERFTMFVRYTQQQGVQTAYHHHMGTAIESAQDVDNLMLHTDEEVGLLLNTGHLIFVRADPLTVAQRWAPRINHVHCKDIRTDVLADVEDHKTSFPDTMLSGVFAILDDGYVDYPPVIQLLKTQDYHGWLVMGVEQDPATIHPLAYARLGYNNLNRLARDVGLI